MGSTFSTRATQNPPTDPVDPKEEPRRKEGDEEEEEEEEEGECGFCVFMKGGGCKDAFVAWEDCINEAEGNEEEIVEKCFEATSNLSKCMEAHPDYYEPILRAEKKAEGKKKKEEEVDKEKAASDPPEVRVEISVEEGKDSK